MVSATSQLNLFNPPVRRTTHPARNTDPAPSHIAAREITKTGSREAQRQQVADLVNEHPGRTSHDLAQLANLDRHMVAKRLPDAAAHGLVHKGPQGASTNGRPGVTWLPGAAPEDAV